MKGQAGRKKGTNDEVCSPRDLFDALSRELGGFDLDVAATDANTLVPGKVGEQYFTQECSAFDHSWRSPDGPTQAWMNPPYSHVRPWIERARDEVQNSDENHRLRVAMLLKAEPTSVWWQETISSEPASKVEWSSVGALARGLKQQAQILKLWRNDGIVVEIRFPRGRLKYGGMLHSADFPSAVVLLHKADDAWGLR